MRILELAAVVVVLFAFTLSSHAREVVVKTAHGDDSVVWNVVKP